MAQPAASGRGGVDGIRLDTGDGSTVTCSRVPPVIGNVLVPAEMLRHQQVNAATGGIWRVRGSRGSAVLKIARPPSAERAHMAWPTSDDPVHWNYWRRELLAYETGLSGTAYRDAGIAAPALLEMNTRADAGVEVWLEDVSGIPGFEWDVPRIGRFARELGAGQARWAGRVPETPWLSRRWLAQYLVEEPSRSVSVQDADWDDPRAASWAADVRLQLRRLWAGRNRMLAAAEAAERTLCHLDVWPANLLDASGVSVLLDWPFTGEGAVGEDAANLIVDSFTDGLMDVALLPEVAEVVADGYIDGLRAGGWTGSADSVRSAIAACGAAKYCWFGPAVVGRALRDDPGNQSYGQDSSAAAKLERVTGLVTLIAQWAGAFTITFRGWPPTPSRHMAPDRTRQEWQREP
jgi:hypothetical protein